MPQMGTGKQVHPVHTSRARAFRLSLVSLTASRWCLRYYAWPFMPGICRGEAAGQERMFASLPARAAAPFFIHPLWSNKMAKHVEIDQGECLGCESCVELCPEVFGFNENLGKAEVLKEDGEEKCIDEAVASCPAGCISWE